MHRATYCAGKVKFKAAGTGPREKIFSCSEEEEGEHMHVSCVSCGYIEIQGINPDAHDLKHPSKDINE